MKGKIIERNGSLWWDNATRKGDKWERRTIKLEAKTRTEAIKEIDRLIMREILPKDCQECLNGGNNDEDWVCQFTKRIMDCPKYPSENPEPKE
jgi:hypothetical protein